MLYRFDSQQHHLDPFKEVQANAAEVLEKQLELAVARCPSALFRTTAAGEPILVVKTSVPGKRMADIIGLDGEGRLVLVECKRGWATRDALAQLLDYAADYAGDTYAKLQEEWKSGEGKESRRALLEEFRDFADDQKLEPSVIR